MDRKTCIDRLNTLFDVSDDLLRTRELIDKQRWIVQLIHGSRDFIILAEEFPVTAPDPVLRERLVGCLSRLKLFLTSWSEMLFNESFRTTSGIIEIDGYNINDVDQRTRLIHELRALKKQNNYTEAPADITGLRTAEIEARMIANFLPDMDPVHFTEEIIHQGQKKYAEWLERSKLLREKYANYLTLFNRLWACMKTCEVRARPKFTLQERVRLKDLVNELPPFEKILSEMLFDPSTLRRDSAYKQNPILSSITVENFTDEMLEMPIMSMSLIQIMLVMQWLRTCYWYIPFHNYEWMRKLKAVEDRLGMVCYGPQTLNEMCDPKFAQRLDEKSVPPIFAVTDFVVDWKSATLRGLWSKYDDASTFAPQEHFDVAQDHIDALMSFLLRISDEVSPSDEMREALKHDIRSMYLTFGSIALHALNHANPDYRIEVIVPTQISGKLDQYISKILHQDYGHIIRLDGIGMTFRFIIAMHLLHVFLDQCVQATGFLQKHVFPSTRRKGIELHFKCSEDVEKHPVFAQIANHWCIIHKGKILYNENVFALIVLFFQIIAIDCNAKVCHRNIAEILRDLKIKTNKATQQEEVLRYAFELDLKKWRR